MRICILSARFYPQIVGSGTSAYLAAQALRTRGHEVDIVTDHAIEERLSSEILPFSMHYVHDLENYATGRASFQTPATEIYDVLQNKEYDVLHVHNFMPMLLVSIMRPLLKMPVVFTFHNTPNSDERALGYFDNSTLDLQLARSVIAARQYEHLVVGSQCYYDFSLHLGADQKSTTLSYLGIDQAKFTDSKKQNSKAITQYLGSLRKRRLLILLPGRIVERKGIMEAVQAIAQINEVLPADLLLTGMSSPFSSTFARLVLKRATDLGVADKVIIPKKVIPRKLLSIVYSMANVVITPSYYEGLGLAAIEALALGKPLVATRVAGLNEIVQNGMNAIVIPPKDPVALANAVIKLVREPALAKRLAAAGPASVAKFDMNIHACVLESIYKEVFESWK